MEITKRCNCNRPKLIAFITVAFVFTLSLNFSGRGSFRQDKSTAHGFLHHCEQAPTTPVDSYDTGDDESSPLVLNTIGCKIPNAKVGWAHATSEPTDESAGACGERLLRVRKLNSTHAQLAVDGAAAWPNKTWSLCTYKFVYRSTTPGEEDHKIRYSPGIDFSSPITFKLKSDFIKVRCVPPSGKGAVYEDSFVAVSKRSPEGARVAAGAWSVLIVGMDTMSRARMLGTMPRTTRHFRQNGWIDFRGYHKIGDNTWPNLMAVLTGTKRSFVDRACSGGMDACNHLLMWSKFREMGYVTAYAEDYLSLPDTFSTRGFRDPPTDHYLRPFFLTGERTVSSKTKHTTVCAGTRPSATHVLDYAKDFAETYKRDPFFGFFWINSYSHNVASSPEAIDDRLTTLFGDLQEIGILNNTFVIFLSDHGVRFGNKRIPMASYYEERLPSMFLWAPLAFRDKFKNDFSNLESNGNRLVTPYDLYVTMEDILRRSTGWDKSTGSSACPGCRSLLREVPSERTCEDAAVEPKWCSCHSMTPMALNNTKGIACVNAALEYVRSFSAVLETQKCTKCEKFHLHSILRMHYYYSNDTSMMYVVVAFEVAPGEVGYEATVSHSEGNVQIVGQISIISPHFGKGFCVKKKKVSQYCYCTRIPKCR